jgi:hypothetical protein
MRRDFNGMASIADKRICPIHVASSRENRIEAALQPAD